MVMPKWSALPWGLERTWCWDHWWRSDHRGRITSTVERWVHSGSFKFGSLELGSFEIGSFELGSFKFGSSTGFHTLTTDRSLGRNAVGLSVRRDAVRRRASGRTRSSRRWRTLDEQTLQEGPELNERLLLQVRLVRRQIGGDLQIAWQVRLDRVLQFVPVGHHRTLRVLFRVLVDLVEVDLLLAIHVVMR